MHDQSTGKASPSIGRGARPNRSRSRSLPSAIEICLAEKISPAKAKRLASDKRFCKELQDQVLHDLSHFPYVDTLDCSGSVITDSILGSRVLSYLDDFDQPIGEGQSSKLAPTKELPWIDGLDASGVMGVREEAHSALPSLRALIRSAAFSDTKTRASALDDLRAQVVEVENELRTLKIVRRRTNMIAAAGLLLGVAGYGTRQPATILAGLAGFLSALAAAHGSSTTAELREHALIHKPAYLLLKARDSRESSGH